MGFCTSPYSLIASCLPGRLSGSSLGSLESLQTRLRKHLQRLFLIEDQRLPSYRDWEKATRGAFKGLPKELQRPSKELQRPSKED